ncbi:sodium/hydrogen exchanger, putative [Theileria annulata]|uniref:Sodium/hydrogen exchanger, putative n=1 Tax=Theileria annulata TaxID=5874 RepID=Q4UEZ0_THEAN|nr:sodium/hydrogen exchanger, putative [Theileria annulata]CAI74349.1 sodium/hydrogen exchanger, putative [Theileria annulata]|eukprot:XP_952081.1 sodium/hydrogen exchanger, putative [Theileria annulata]
MTLINLIKFLASILAILVLHIEGASCDSDNVNLSGVSENLASLVSVTVFILISSCFLHFLSSKINDKIPISLVLFIYGMLIYGILMNFDHEKLPVGILRWVSSLRNIDNSILYFVALPILLYEATQTIDWYSFCNFLLAGISLAVIGVVLQVAILGILFHYTLRENDIWSFFISFLLASILSSTDPVAVLSILGDSTSSHKLITMFNGESLINDGTSVLLFQFFYLLSINEKSSYWYYIMLFIKLLILSPLLGIACAIVVIVWISFFRKCHNVQCIISISIGYLLYFCAEYYLNISGPLCIVCYGIFIKAYGLITFDKEALEKHHVLIESLSYMSNCVVFLISGIITVGMLRSQFKIKSIGIKTLRLVVVYIYLNITRTIMLLLFKPLLTYTGYQINFKELLLLIWGGLRGAMVLVLGLRLENDKKISNSISDLLSFYISGSTMIILILHGFTFNMLYKLLNPYPVKEYRIEYLNKTMKFIEDKYLERLSNLENYWLYKNTDVLEKANLLVPVLSNVKWTKLGTISYNVTHANIKNLMVIDERKGATQEELDIEDEENIFLLNPELNSNFAHDYLNLNSQTSDLYNMPQHSGSGISATGIDTQIPPGRSMDNMEAIRYGVSNFSSDYEIAKKASIAVNEPFSKEDFSEIDSGGGKDLDEYEIYIIIFNGLLYMYNEMYNKSEIDGKSLLTLKTIINISLDFSINKLKQRSLNIWKNVKNSKINKLYSMINYENFNDGGADQENQISVGDFEDVSKINGFEFEWILLKNNLEYILSKRLNFININNASFVLDIILSYILAHEKLVVKQNSIIQIILGNKLLESYMKQINNAKKYVFIIKNKMNVMFYYCLLIKTSSSMINIKKEIVKQYYSNGMLLDEDEKKLNDLLDEYKISNKSNYTKIIKFIIKKFYQMITFRKNIYTTTNIV